jgi:AcrR family transcriptional regulator
MASDDGRVIAHAAEAYRKADRLEPFGFSGWIGREPHGVVESDCGTVRDGVFAEQVVELFDDLARARRDGPWLAVASFVNPHDIAFAGGFYELLLGSTRSTPCRPCDSSPVGWLPDTRRYITLRHRMMPTSTTATASTTPGTGRPRDPRIDDAVLHATAELLQEVGYLQLTIGAIAARAGTNKPAIYRRWPTKAHLVHEAVFPAPSPELITDADALRSDIRALVAIGVDLLGRPAARAALPGLLAEMTSDPTLHADVIGRFAGSTWGRMQNRIEHAIEMGEVRADVQPSTVLELIAGSTFVATAIRPLNEIGPDWIDDIVDLIMRGIEP